MTAKEFFDVGDLSSAISQAGEDIKRDPTDESQRTFLFELLCCAGDLERAVKQLDVLAAGKDDGSKAVQSYRNVLEGEKKRRQFFNEGRPPGLPKHVPAYTSLHLEAAGKIREGKFDEARALLEQAEDLRVPVGGILNNEPFDDLKDADDLIGPFLEVITSTNYSWVPWEVVRSVVVLAPQHLRDMVWIPARVELHFGALGEVFIPTLYAGSSMHPDFEVKLGRLTDWRSGVAGLVLGQGQRVLTADDRDYPLLEVRSLEIQPSEGTDGNTSGSN